MRSGAEGEGGNMKRLLRWAFNLATVVSAVLFVATCVLWVRSYWTVKELDGVTAIWHAEWKVASSYGELWFEQDQLVSGGAFDNKEVEEPYTENWSLGFSVVRLHGPFARSLVGSRFYGETLDVQGMNFSWWGTRIRFLAVPDWIVVTASLVLPMCYLMRRFRTCRRSRRHVSGLCLSCGYDLRATPHRCPECGKVPKAMGAA
jgi:hypothetical protein